VGAGSPAAHRRRLARWRERLSTLELQVIEAAGGDRGRGAVLDNLIGMYSDEELERMFFPTPERPAT